MEHRKRSMMQHKVEISTLLRIAMVNNPGTKFYGNDNGGVGITKSLAFEAMESLKNCDRCGVTARQDNMAWVY